MREKDRQVQMEYFRKFLKAGVKDAEIARRSGYGRVRIGQMRHGHAPITEPVGKAMISILQDIDAAQNAFERFMQDGNLHLLPKGHRPPRQTKKQRKAVRRAERKSRAPQD